MHESPVETRPGIEEEGDKTTPEEGVEDRELESKRKSLSTKKYFTAVFLTRYQLRSTELYSCIDNHSTDSCWNY
ncbi:hypothetical protein L1987_48130 [Smallanthus sonchifolius]|uniref:Uncharacterized protein n=1 Tax=Smallanthus sonchifolius TaxID=185202 RepID=A0ACB9FS03_9ASTR|nr:hypothetical protein L1987_48130 [Smallanthus sonchifolius]